MADPPPAAPTAAAAPVPVIIDTDPGVDDALAILMALAHPGFNIIGITTTGGNVPLARATRNALALLEYAGRGDIPVHRGAARPLAVSPAAGRYPYAREVHSAAGLTHPLPKPTLAPADTPAVPFLDETLTAMPGAVTIIALGPLTNLARLLRRRPAALSAAARIIIMGGAVNTPGNITPHAEFNFYSDPTAARLVIESGIPITLIDLAACRQVYFTRAESDRIIPASDHTVPAGDSIIPASRLGQLAARLLAGWFRKDPTRRRFHLYDPLAVIAAADPSPLSLHPATIAVDAPSVVDTPAAVDDAGASADAALWGRCRITNPTAGPISIAAPDQVDAPAALDAIRRLLSWTDATAPCRKDSSDA